MNRIKLPEIILDPATCHGKPVIAGTRIMVWQILELLKSGETPKAIYTAYPTLPPHSIEAALHYAAQKAKSEYYVPFTEEKQTQVFA